MENTEIQPRRGLTREEVSERIEKGLVNGDQTIRTKSYGNILFTNVFTYFNFVFTVIFVILAVTVGFDLDGIGNYGFVFLVFFNTAVGVVQEMNAKHTMDKLSLISAPKVRVIRDGAEETVAVKDVVLDDVTVLAAGDQITADSVVVSGSIEVNESLITGEPDAILKHPGDEIMSGSYVVSGKAEARVEHVGMDNFAMKISEGAKYFKKPTSEIKISLSKIIRAMSYVILPVGLALFFVKHYVHGLELNDTIISTMGTLVGLIPSGLVALSTAVFTLSVIRIAKHKTLAQDMYCVETLARVDVLCLDKTGTITEGTMEVRETSAADGDEEAFGRKLRNLMDAVPDDSATANAVRDYVSGYSADAVADEIVPFSSDRKWSGAVFSGTAYVLGAPEFVFPGNSAGTAELTAEKAREGYRVLVLGSAPGTLEGRVLPEGLRLEGYVFIADKIRAEAPDTLRFFRDQGVDVKIISGDNPETVSTVAGRAGLENCGNMIDMSTLKTDDEVAAAAERYTIFGRVLPHQKLTLIKTLKRNGHTVAMTGDGVNDVLALKEADVSVAMASGSDAAKNVSSLVLLDSNFQSMPRVVAEGRRSINNLERTSSLFILKTFYTFLIAMIFLVFPGVLPFAPKHLTLLGGVTIGIPATVMALEKDCRRVEGRFLPKTLVRTFTGIAAVMTGIGGVAIAVRYVCTGLSTEQQQCMYFLCTVFAGYLYLFKTCWRFNPVRAALYAFVLILLPVCWTVPPPLDFVQTFFGLHRPVTPEMWRAVAVIWSVILPVFCASWALDARFGDAVRKKLSALMDARPLKYGTVPRGAIPGKKKENNRDGE